MASLSRTSQMGVYAITHLPTGRQYVGASIDIARRWQEHRRALRRGDHESRVLQEVWNETIPGEWAWAVIEEVAHRDTLARCEQQWIERLKPELRHPYRRPWRAATNSFDARRFWARLRKCESCWNWTGCLSSCGYGKVSYQGRSDYAHRVAWMLTHGPIADDLCVLHSCDNRRCCRVEHLFLGSKTDNALDRERKGRHRSGTVPRERAWFVRHPELVARGERAPGAKLMAERVLELRQRAALGESKAALARAFGVSKDTVRRIVQGQSWRHVPALAPDSVLAD